MTPNPLAAATAVQEMAGNAANRKLAIAFTTMSVALVGVMLLREVSHCLREEFREHDRRSMWPGDRRR
jgi:hypothetical protein